MKFRQLFVQFWCLVLLIQCCFARRSSRSRSSSSSSSSSLSGTALIIVLGFLFVFTVTVICITVRRSNKRKREQEQQRRMQQQSLANRDPEQGLAPSPPAAMPEQPPPYQPEMGQFEKQASPYPPSNAYPGPPPSFDSNSPGPSNPYAYSQQPSAPLYSQGGGSM
eukprot:GCRY01002689.1.p1 GENE.GCRY01002689.1~~GCRY01002689.1.p1  ORF type:complete len:165 (-),score=1.82 GCRY01002689.1:624-1118(-)